MTETVDQTGVGYTSSGSVGRITISRPKRRNALNAEALAAFHAAISEARDEGVRVLVVRGAEGHFCAGADLTELEDLEFTNQLRRALDDLAGLPFPTIAAICGSCMGLGMQIAVACDLRIASPDARFAVPVAKLGLMVDHWTLSRLSMLAGQSTARWLTMTAQPIDAERAHTVGFVQEVTRGSADGQSDAPDPMAVWEAADELAAGIAKLAPLALSGTKLGLDLLSWSVDGESSYEGAFSAAWASEDLVEGRTAFSERRPPEFRGR